MGRSLELVRQQTELAMQRAARNPGPPRTHLVAFLMTPFAAAFDRPREAIRRIIEDRYGCELLNADQKTFDDFIHGNVGRHIQDADLFIADVTGANPNVMMELGAAIYGGTPAASAAAGRPRLRLLVAAADQPELPADLKGHITARYPAEAEPEAIAKALADEFAKHQPLTALLERARRERYLSPATLHGFVGGAVRLPDATYTRLSEALPTDSRWHRATDAELAPMLGPEFKGLAGFILERIRTGLDQHGAG